MKTSFTTLASVITVGLVFVSGCEHSTEPLTDSESGTSDARATTHSVSTTEALPDLTIDAARLASSMFIAKVEKFKATSCAVQEECCGVGKRRLLKFEAFIPNIGAGDFALGNPAENPDLFEFSECHGHYHLSGFASYELLSPDGTVVLTGRKQAFCLMDFTRIDGAGTGLYTCSNQGIQAGWADVYGSNLDCQWLDITDIPPGEYRLSVTVNATPGTNPKLQESNFGNNTAVVPVTIPPAGKVKP